MGVWRRVQMLFRKKSNAARVEEFRTRRDATSASYRAAKSQIRAGEAITGVSRELPECAKALGRAEEKRPVYTLALMTSMN